MRSPNPNSEPELRTRTRTRTLTLTRTRARTRALLVALTRCQQLGGDLASIHNAVEDAAARALLASAHADAAWIGFAASSADSPRVTCTDTPHYDVSGSAVRDSNGNSCGFYSVECVIDPNTGQPVRR